MNPTHEPSLIADRFAGFGTSIFTEMSRLAQEHDAVNLSQGSPDFDGPDLVKLAAMEAMRTGHNQYAPMGGVPDLAAAIAAHWLRQTGQRVDPATQVTVTSGCTEALAATMAGLVNPGDEVILFEPYYDSYRAVVALAGASPRFVALRPPAQSCGTFGFDERELRAAFSDRTRAIIVNTPHNPSGKVFTRDELTLLSELCNRHDAFVVSDEVYEFLTYDGVEFVRPATVPGLEQRTLSLSSLGKSFSLTGWKIGWAVGSVPLTQAIRSAHQFITFSCPTPLQHGAAAALNHGGASIAELHTNYAIAREYLHEVLGRAGFRPFRPQGTYFILADHTPVSARLGLDGDVELCRYLTRTVGVAAIPPSAFYERRELGRPLVRFSFCKSMPMLELAARRLIQMHR